MLWLWPRGGAAQGGPPVLSTASQPSGRPRAAPNAAARAHTPPRHPRCARRPLVRPQCVTKCCEKFLNLSARTGQRFQELFSVRAPTPCARSLPRLAGAAAAAVLVTKTSLFRLALLRTAGDGAESCGGRVQGRKAMTRQSGPVCAAVVPCACVDALPLLDRFHPSLTAFLLCSATAFFGKECSREACSGSPSIAEVLRFAACRQRSGRGMVGPGGAQDRRLRERTAAAARPASGQTSQPGAAVAATRSRAPSVAPPTLLPRQLACQSQSISITARQIRSQPPLSRD